MPHFDGWFMISARKTPDRGDIMKWVNVMGILADYRGPSGGVLPGPRRGKGEIIKDLRKLFQSKSGVLLAYLFGSCVQEESSPSDVDIALLLQGEDFHALFQELMIEIPEVLETERLDLLILNRATPVLAFEVVAGGEIIYFRDEAVLNDFEMGIIRKFQDTAYLRKVQNEYLKQRVKEWYSKRNTFLNG